MMDRDRRLKAMIAGLSEDTQAIRVGLDRTAEREHSEPIFTTSSFVFPDAETMADAFVNNSGLSIYARVDNPTIDGFCKRLAVLEGADACEATATGMGAVLSTLMAHCQSGDRVLMSTGVFGATLNLVKNYFVKWSKFKKSMSLGDKPISFQSKSPSSNIGLPAFLLPANR